MFFWNSLAFSWSSGCWQFDLGFLCLFFFQFFIYMTLKIEGAKCGAKCSLRRSWRKSQTDGASKDKLPGFSWVEDSNSPSHNTLLRPSRPGQNTQHKLHRELQQTWWAPHHQESKSVSYTRTYFSWLLETLRQSGTPGLWDARWEWRILMGGSCPTYIDCWYHFFFSLIKICTHLPGLSLPWQQQKLRVSRLVEQHAF